MIFVSVRPVSEPHDGCVGDISVLRFNEKLDLLDVKKGDYLNLRVDPDDYVALGRKISCKRLERNFRFLESYTPAIDTSREVYDFIMNSPLTPFILFDSVDSMVCFNAFMSMSCRSLSSIRMSCLVLAPCVRFSLDSLLSHSISAIQINHNMELTVGTSALLIHKI